MADAVLAHLPASGAVAGPHRGPEPHLRPLDLVSIEREIPDAVAIGRVDPKPARRFGDAWVRRGDSATLLVPSAAIHDEWNVLLNPSHPDFVRVTFRSPVRFQFDVRMFR
jgi:hypothetical protein